MSSILKIFKNNRFSAAAVSEKGDVRKINQDNFYVAGHRKTDPDEENISYDLNTGEKQLLCAVFDGMGGETDGEIASFIAANKMAELPEGQFDNAESIVSGYESLNSAVMEYSSGNIEGNCGTTAVVLSLSSKYAQVSNIGDSAAYLMRGGRLKKLSHDHSIFQQYADMGMRLEGNAGRNLLTQFVGLDPRELPVEPYIADKTELEPGDIFLLCSDGVCGVLTPEDIALTLIEKTEVHEKAEKLVRLSYEKGSRDNATAVVVAFKN